MHATFVEIVDGRMLRRSSRSGDVGQ